MNVHHAEYEQEENDRKLEYRCDLSDFWHPNSAFLVLVLLCHNTDPLKGPKKPV